MDSGHSIRTVRKPGAGVAPAFLKVQSRRALRRAAGPCLVAFAIAAASLSDLQAQTIPEPVTTMASLPDAPGFAEAPQAGAAGGGTQSEPAAPATLSGTVLDPNGGVVVGAQVVLTGANPEDRRETTSGANGQFTFSGLAPETYEVTVTGRGMGTVVSPAIRIHAGEIRFLPELILPVNAGITQVKVFATEKQLQEEEAEVDVHIEESQRVLGVIPNFYSAFDWNAPPLDAKQKFKLAFRSEIDPITFAGAAAIAGGEEYKKIYPGYGTEFGGFGKRFAAQYVNDFDSRMIGSALLPSLFRQDPRYFYKGKGTVGSRALYAIKSAFICRGDNGKPEFDFSHMLGNMAAGGLANLYYPESNEGPGLVFANSMIEVAGMAGTNLLREFVLRGITSHVPIHGAGKP